MILIDEKVVNSVKVHVDGLLRRAGRGDLMEKLEELRFFEAPASTKYHLSCRGGLAVHSLGVTLTALRIAKATGMLEEVGEDKIIIAGILHDVGKCGLLKNGVLQPRFVFEGGKYVFNECKPYIHLTDLSALYVAQWVGDWDIIQAVRSHDGQYVEENHAYAHKQCKLSHLIMAADTLIAQTKERLNEVEEGYPLTMMEY